MSRPGRGHTPVQSRRLGRGRRGLCRRRRCLRPAILRGDPELGFAALLFLFAIVWATDIFAYLVGRAVGGPLLWPAVSPKKTWAGAIRRASSGGLPPAPWSPMRALEPDPPWRAFWHWYFQLLRKAVTYSNPRSSGDLARRTRAALFPATAASWTVSTAFWLPPWSAVLIGIAASGHGCAGPGLIGMVAPLWVAR